MTGVGSSWGSLTPAERRRSVAFWGLQAVLIALDVAGAVHWPWWVVWSPPNVCVGPMMRCEP